MQMKQDFEANAGQLTLLAQVMQAASNPHPVSYTHLDVYKRQAVLLGEIEPCLHAPEEGGGRVGRIGELGEQALLLDLIERFYNAGSRACLLYTSRAAYALPSASWRMGLISTSTPFRRNMTALTAQSRSLIHI